METPLKLSNISGIALDFDTDEHGAARVTVTGPDYDAVLASALSVKNVLPVEHCPEVGVVRQDINNGCWCACVRARSVMSASVRAVEGDGPIAALDLNLRITNRLGAEGAFHAGDLCLRRPSDLMKLPGFGTKSLREVEAALQRAGRALRAEATRR